MSVHEVYQRADKTRYCVKCDQIFPADSSPSGECVKVYDWSPWPEGLYTKAQLGEKGYNPGPVAGVIPREKSPHGWMKLYRVEDAKPKRKPSEKQLAALEKAKQKKQEYLTCKRCGLVQSHYKYMVGGLCEECDFDIGLEADRLSAAKTAYDLVCQGDFVVWDSEATDLEGRFIEVAVVDQHGRILFNERIAPGELIEPGAFAVHGIRDIDLVACPTFFDVYPRLREALHGKHWLIYNSAFDTNVLWRETHRTDYKHYYAAQPITPADDTCIMHLYAQWFGDYSHYYKSYKWQSLQNAMFQFNISVDHPAHSALGDALGTLELVYKLAEWYRKETLTNDH